MLANNLLGLVCLSLAVGMISSWQVLAGIDFTIIASWICVTGANFLSCGVPSCLGWYAGVFVHISFILFILFKKKSARSSASWLLVVPVGSGFSSLFPSMLFNALNNCLESLLASSIFLPGDVFYCSLAFYCIFCSPVNAFQWWFSPYLMYTLSLFLTIFLCFSSWLVYHGLFFFFFAFFPSSGAIISRVLSISSLNIYTASFMDDCSSILLLLNFQFRFPHFQQIQNLQNPANRYEQPIVQSTH